MSSCSTSSEARPTASCGCGDSAAFDGASFAYKRVLAAVIAINILAFGVVAVGSWWANSASLAANTLDFAADAATDGVSLWAIGQSVRVRTSAAMIKGASLGLMAAGILGLAVYRAIAGVQPDGGAISGLGLFGAVANLVAALLLMRYRDGDANVRSVWLCTRNDLIQCLAVAATGVAVSLTHSGWPDLVVGVLLSAVFLRSAWQITAQARDELSAAEAPAAPREYVTHSNHPQGQV